MKFPRFAMTALAAALASGSLTAHGEDLLEVYNLGLQNDPQYAAAREVYNGAREAKPQAIAALLPQLSATGSTGSGRTDFKGGVNNQTSTQFISSAKYDTYSWSVDLTQTIFRLDRFLQLGRADASIAQALANFNFAGQDLIMRVTKAYFDLLGAQDSLEFAKAQKTAIGKQLEQAKLQFDVGTMPITDVKEAQASYDLATADEITADNAVDVSRETLRAIVGKDIQGVAPLTDKLKLLPPDPTDPDKWVATAEATNQQLLATRFQTDASRRDVAIARAGHLPTVDLEAASDHSNANQGAFGPRRSTDETYQFTAKIPIFSGGLTMSRTRQAVDTFHQAQDVQESRRRETIRMTRASYLKVMAGISRVNALAQAVESNASSSESTQAGFEVGTRNSVDVVNALRDTYRAKRDFARARYDYIVDSLSLKQAAGTLAGTDVEAMNAWLR